MLKKLLLPFGNYQFRNNNKTNRIFNKLVLCFFLSIFLSAIIVGLVTYFNSSLLIKKQVNKIHLDSLNDSTRSLDEKINMLQQSIYGNYDYTSIMRLQNVKGSVDEKDEQNITNIISMLSKIKGSSDVLQDAFIYFKESGSLISSASKYDADTFFSRVYQFKFDDLNRWIDNFYQSDKLRLFSTNEFIYYSPQYHKVLSAIAFVYSLPINTWKQNAALIILLKDTSISDIINESNLLGEGTNLLLNSKGDILLGSTGSFTRYDFKKSQISNKIHNYKGSNGSFTANLGGSQRIIYFTKSEFADFDILSVVPAQYTNNLIYQLKNTTIILGICLVFISIVASLILSRYIYGFLIYDPNSLKQSNIYIKERFIHKLINSYLEENTDIQSELIDLGLCFNEDKFLMSIVQIDNYVDFIEKNSENDTQQIKKNITEIIKNQLEENVKVYVLKEYEYIAILINFDDHNDNIISKLVTDFNIIQEKLRNNFNLSITVGIGLPVIDITKLCISYSQAKSALKTKAFLGRNGIYTYVENENEDEDVDIFYLTLGEQEKILGYLNHGNISKDYEYVESIIDTGINANKGNFEYLNELFRQFLGLGVYSLYSLGISLNEIYGKSFNIYKEFRRCETVDEMKEFIKKQYLFIGEHVKKIYSQKKAIKDSVLNIIKYIENNYQRDISLNEIAEHFHLSPAYFSRYFKQITGSTLIDYINSQRIEKAKALMLDRTKPIREVSQEVGFNNYKTFSRAFKKYTGASPEAYKSNKLYDS